MIEITNKIGNVTKVYAKTFEDEDCIKEGITEPTKDFPWYSLEAKVSV